MIPLAESDRLHRLLAELPELGEDGNWLADLIRTQLAEMPGQDSRSVRAQLIQDLAALYPGRSSRRAKDMAKDARRYAATCWPRNRNEIAPPAYHQRKPEAVLFELHRNAERGGGRWPLAWRSLTSILQFSALATANVSSPSSAHQRHREVTMKPIEFDEQLRVKLPGPLMKAVSEAAAEEAESASHFVRRTLISALRERGIELTFSG